MITRPFIGGTDLHWDGGKMVVLRDSRKKIIDCVFIEGRGSLAAGRAMEAFENRLMCIAEFKIGGK